jgi:hypothetical protein
MTIKYEPVFGDQSLFDNAPEDAEMIGGLKADSGLFYKVLNGKLFASFNKHDPFTEEYETTIDRIQVRAMRRVIKTPIWTREDQEAGVLPPVGVRILVSSKPCLVIFSNTELIVVLFDNDAVAQIYRDEVEDCCEAIETPEEKAARLKDEWLLHAANFCQPGKIFEGIYDALLSGELKAPTND